MEKRFVSFIIVSMAILLAYQALDMRLNPRPAEPPPEALPAEEIVQEEAPRAEAEAPADVEPLATAEVEPPPSIDLSPAAELAGTQGDEQWTTLGSLDHARPEKLLVWFSSRGAAIECIALNDERYTDLDNRHGYLGYLALRDTAEGCRIGAVGQGTPAAMAAASGQPAGLQAGDILQQIDETSIADCGDYLAWVETTKPAQEVRIRVRRSTDGEWTTLDYTATLDHRPLEIIRPEPERPTVSDPRHPASYLVALQQLGDQKVDFTADELTGIPSLKREPWELRQIERDGQPGVEFHFLLSAEQLAPFGVTGPLRIIKRYMLARPDEASPNPEAGFHLRYELVFRNEASDGTSIPLAYQQNGPSGLPLEGWWYTYKTHPRNFGRAGVRDVVFKTVEGRHEMFTNPKIVKRIDEPNPMTLMFEEGSEPRLDYVGVDSQYFLSALLPDPEAEKEWPDRYRLADAMALAVAPQDPVKAARTDVSFRLISPVQVVEPNNDYVQSYVIYAGPKHPDVLKQYGLEECITYGWFRVVAKPLQWILHAFHAVFRNYGIAIILLTVLVRGCMFPLGRQQVMNAEKMQELAPEMRRIAEQYKNDMEKRAAAQRDLFRKHNYNPMAGCLPMFFQLPIFIGLYRALSVDIELRQAPLIPGLHWCSNLAGPDQLLYWESFMPAFLASRTGWLGPYLNILPLVSVAFMMVHQKMFTPPPTDDQQEMQQRMMKFMMLFFALMFFRVPAGLCLYFITSSAWGLAERKLLPKAKPAGPESGGGGSGGGGTAGGGSGGGAVGLLKKVLGPNGTPAPSTKRRTKSKRR